MQRNKAQLQLQFNWIFVLIVGAALLLFFFTVIGGQSKSNEQGIAINLAQRMKTILAATEQQPGTIKIYDRIPSLEINFACNASQDFYNYQVEGVDAVDTKYNLIFSPLRLQGNVIYTWTEEWRIPYPVANFLYLSNNKQHYVFYNGTEYAPMTRLYETFPEDFSKRAWQEGEADKNLNMDGYTYIFFLRQFDIPSLSLSFANTNSNADGKVIIIDPVYPTDPYAYGDIYYLRLDQVKTVDDTEDISALLSSAQKTTYLGEASLYGAIFSSSTSSYECTMAKAMHRLQILTLLQYYRTQYLAQEASPNCEYLLNATLVGAAPILRTINETVSKTFTTETMEDLFEFIDKLDSVNNQLATMSNCPAIY